jgi:hypothetical protein
VRRPQLDVTTRISLLAIGLSVLILGLSALLDDVIVR